MLAGIIIIVVIPVREGISEKNVLHTMLLRSRCSKGGISRRNVLHAMLLRSRGVSLEGMYSTLCLLALLGYCKD